MYVVMSRVTSGGGGCGIVTAGAVVVTTAIPEY